MSLQFRFVKNYHFVRLILIATNKQKSSSTLIFLLSSNEQKFNEVSTKSIHLFAENCHQCGHCCAKETFFEKARSLKLGQKRIFTLIEAKKPFSTMKYSNDNASTQTSLARMIYAIFAKRK